MFSCSERSRIMSKIRSRGNAATELRFIKILKEHGITGWRRGLALPGRPDFVFPNKRMAIFIDGDFWHGNPSRFRLPKTNVAYWKEKIAGNQKRDRRTNRILRAQGWKVYRFWQSALSQEAVVLRRLHRGLDPIASQRDKRQRDGIL